jgi:hypothetical protein
MSNASTPRNNDSRQLIMRDYWLPLDRVVQAGEAAWKIGQNYAQ